MNSFNWQIPDREQKQRPSSAERPQASNNPWAAIAFALMGFIIGFALQSLIGK